MLVETAVGFKGSIRLRMKGLDTRIEIKCGKILFETNLQTKKEFIMEDFVKFSEFPLFNNLKVSSLCNEGACPEKDESVMNDVDILPTLYCDMARGMDSLLSMINLLLNLIFFQCTGN